MTNLIGLRSIQGLLLVVSLSACVSCKTTSPEPVAAVLPPVTSFEPAQALARIAADQGRYANLFAPESHAIWVGPEVAAAMRAAAVEAGETIDPNLDRVAGLINENYYVFELRLESVFEDTSIAYDAVGMRGVDAYVTTPAGYRVPPIQRIIGGTADETPVGALRRFGRTNILVFAKRDVLSSGPALPSSAPAVRLLLEGHNSGFYFEWQRAGGEGPLPEGPSRTERMYSQAKMGFSELYSRLRVLGHVFD